MTKDRAVYRDGQLISPAGNVVDHSVELDLQPSGYDIRLHPASNGVLHVEPDGTLRSVLGKSNLPYLPQETVATFLGRIELADGSSITFDHKGRFYSGDELQATTMPAAAAAPNTKASGLIDYAELRRQVSISQVLELIGWKPVRSKGDQLRGPCPIHRSAKETSRSFSVNVKKHVYRCFKPGCEAKGNQIDLYIAVTGLPIYEACLELCEKTGTDVPSSE